MATPIQPPQVPLSLDELRKKRASVADFGLPVYSTLEMTDQGLKLCFFQKPNRFALDSDEQMIAITPVALYQAFVTVMGAWLGLDVRIQRMPVPGLREQPNGPSGTPSPASPPA